MTNSLENKDVEPFICEIALSLESISRKDRPQFWESYILQMEVTGSFDNTQYSGVFSISPDISKHPGMHPILQRKLVEAQRLGFKVLRMTVISHRNKAGLLRMGQKLVS